MQNKNRFNQSTENEEERMVNLWKNRIVLCVEKNKSKFVKGGALARRRGPSTTDKIAYLASNFVTPAPSFGALGRVLAGQAFKGVKDNVDYYRKGKGFDIHKAILKVAPKKGFVTPGHKYTGPGNPLEKQVKWDPKTGKILEIYEEPTGKTDAVSMQHDVDYSVCANKPSKDQVKCKNEADRKMVKSLDAIPWKDRQWGHAIARNTIAGKANLGLGVKKGSQKTRKAVDPFPKNCSLPLKYDVYDRIEEKLLHSYKYELIDMLESENELRMICNDMKKEMLKEIINSFNDDDIESENESMHNVSGISDYSEYSDFSDYEDDEPNI